MRQVSTDTQTAARAAQGPPRSSTASTDKAFDTFVTSLKHGNSSHDNSSLRSRAENASFALDDPTAPCRPAQSEVRTDTPAGIVASLPLVSQFCMRRTPPDEQIHEKSETDARHLSPPDPAHSADLANVAANPPSQVDARSSARDTLALGGVAQVRAWTELSPALLISQRSTVCDINAAPSQSLVPVANAPAAPASTDCPAPTGASTSPSPVMSSPEASPERSTRASNDETAIHEMIRRSATQPNGPARSIGGALISAAQRISDAKERRFAHGPSDPAPNQLSTLANADADADLSHRAQQSSAVDTNENSRSLGTRSCSVQPDIAGGAEHTSNTNQAGLSLPTEEYFEFELDSPNTLPAPRPPQDVMPPRALHAAAVRHLAFDFQRDAAASVAVALSKIGDTVSIRLTVRDEKTRRELTTDADALANRLTAGGTNVDEISIQLVSTKSDASDAGAASQRAAPFANRGENRGGDGSHRRRTLDYAAQQPSTRQDRIRSESVVPSRSHLVV